MDQQYSIDDQDQERHFIGNLLSDDEASAARSESSSRSNHKLSSLPSFENVTSNANAIGPSPNQAFWPEPPPPYSPPLSDTFAKWELEAAATGDVFNTFGCGKDKALFPGINSNSSYNPVYTSFTNDLVEDFYSELIKPFEGMPSRVQSKPPPPPSFNQIQQLNAKKALADKKKGRFLQKNMPPSDTELLKRKAEFSSDDLRDPNSFPCLYRQMSEHLPSATTQTSTGILPAGKSYRDVLSTKSTPPQHKPISGVLSAPGNNPKIPTAPILPPHGYSSKVARATSPPMGISSVKKGQSQKGLLPLSIGGVAKLGKNSTVTSAPPATDGLDMGEKAGVEKRAEKQRTIVGLNPIDSQNGNKFGDKSNAKESDSFQKIDRKKKVTKISSNQTSPPQSKSSILAALEIANGKPKNSSGKTTSISKLSEKVKEDQKKSQAFDEQEFEPILTRKNLMKNDVDERMDSDDETFENHTETSDDEDDDVFYAQQNYRLKQKARRGTDPEPKRLLSSSENMPARKKKNKQQHPLPIVYLIMLLTLVWEALVKFGTWIVNLIVDVACLSYWAIVEAATATAWKIVLVYRSCVHAISGFFKNIFLGLWNALKAGIRLTNGCSSEDQFLVGLEENIVLPTCCEEVLERLYTCHPIDAYSILGLKSDCTLEDIRRHYKRQAYLIRPERRLNFGIEQAHRLLTAAFDLLKEPDLRREYDLELLNRVKLKNSELYSLIYDLRWNIDNSTHILHCDCGMEHLVYRLPEMKPLRYCKKCGERHLAKNNDIWVETRIFGLIWTYYTCLNGICFDITNWANCEHNHLKHIKANSHQAYYRLQNVSLLPGQGDLKKHRCTQGFDDSPIYHANFQAYRNAVERLGGVNSNLSKSTFICCCTNSLLNTVESLESVLEEDYIPGVACCMGGTYIGVSTNASAFSCSRSSVDLDPDRAKRAGRRRRIR